MKNRKISLLFENSLIGFIEFDWNFTDVIKFNQGFYCQKIQKEICITIFKQTLEMHFPLNLLRRNGLKYSATFRIFNNQEREHE